VAVGKRHIVLTTEENGLYGWGDGTYGELGICEDLPAEEPVLLPFFDKIRVD